ncbi:MAG: hypothetical protein JXB15_16785 [Anaerolineales bacterium]|nr:hypothetical protein [Anaerolineales bacterium]
MQKIHLWPKEISEQDGLVTASAVIEMPGGERQELWYRLPAEHRHALTSSCDPYVLACLFIAMRCPADLIIHGQASPSLLRNLVEFQQAWALWKPNRYTCIETIPDSEQEQPRLNTDAAIAAFSGGVDSCFTVYRHVTGQYGRWKRNVQAGVFIHGFDISLRIKEDYERAAAKARLMLDSLGLKMIPVATNAKKLGADLIDEHGAFLAAALSMFSGAYTSGLISSSIPYHMLALPWGTNPLTDPLLSSQSFQVVHDGCSHYKIDKIKAISGWPEAMQNLRVCLVGEFKDRNCCRCEKCARTMIFFRALGLPRPPAFEQDISDQQLRKMVCFHRETIDQYKVALETARQNGITASWTGALRQMIYLNEMRVRLKKHPLLWKAGRKLLRGF